MEEEVDFSIAAAMRYTVPLAGGDESPRSAEPASGGGARARARRGAVGTVRKSRILAAARAAEEGEKERLEDEEEAGKDEGNGWDEAWERERERRLADEARPDDGAVLSVPSLRRGEVGTGMPRALEAPQG